MTPKTKVLLILLGVGVLATLLNYRKFIRPALKGPRRRAMKRAAGPRLLPASRGSLTAVGYKVSLTLAGGRTVRPKAVMLHDFSGKIWPKKSCIFGRRPSGGRPAGHSKWFGQGYRPLAATYEIAPGERATLLSLEGWRRVGEVTKIRYDRGLAHPERAKGPPARSPTTAEPRGFYHHAFRRGAAPVLYQRGGVYRLELPRGTVLNTRGFVEPGQ